MVYTFNASLQRAPLIAVCALLALSSCINYKANYSTEAEIWDQHTPDPNLAITHSMYLIGDAGGAVPGDPPPAALATLATHLATAEKESSVVFLGDNIYPNGLASKSEKDQRAMDETKLKAQLDVVKEYKGNVFFIPGNHDWKKYGLDGLKRQRKFIEKYLDREDVFFPKPGCGDPKVVKLNQHLSVILLDSEWWLRDWDDEPEMNDGCDAKSREVFRLHYEEAIKKNRNKNVVVAMHHPLLTMGPHGGQYEFRQHVFPLTDMNPNLWLPLPVIGSIYPLYRSLIGSRQDVAHPQYKELRSTLLGAAKKNGEFIFVSGHEHSLQYFEEDNQAIVVSGSGSKKSATRVGKNGFFAYGQHGFTQIDFYEDGSAWISFRAVTDADPKGKIVYRKQIKGPLESIQARQDTSHDFTFFESGQNTIEVPLSEYDFDKNKFGETFWGKHYRETYRTKLNVPVLDLAQYMGGVTPIKRGGGYQTNSLRLESPDGKQYTMRSIEKDESRAVPYPFNKTFIATILKDFFSTAHPLSALAIPAMAEAVGINYANPKLYYVPKQPRLGEFNEDYGGALYLVEERPDDKEWQEAANFGNPEEVIGTPDVLEAISESHKHLIDQKAMMRARLFDIVLGDWDRHDDQWRWAMHEMDGKKYYRPIPRDRDQAFSHYDGFLTGLLRGVSPYTRQLRKFTPELKKLQWNSYNARQVDRTFINGMDWQDWLEAADHIQTTLTDAVIEKAFEEGWPKTIYDMDAGPIIAGLKARRDMLKSQLRPFYEKIAQKVEIAGTDGHDLFVLQKIGNNSVKVSRYDSNKEGKQQDLLYERTFIGSETREINLYGMGDDDFFSIEGSAKCDILVRLIGGLGDDTYYDRSEGNAAGRKMIVFDTKTGEDNVITLGTGTRKKLTDSPTILNYDRKSQDYEPSYTFLLPALSFNPDDGVLLSFIGNRTVYGFKKAPYGQFHSLNLNYALATSGFRAHYQGDYVNAFGKLGLRLDALFQSPLYSINFYGLGNESVNPEEDLDDAGLDGLDYNRVRQRTLAFSPQFIKVLNSASSYYFGPTIETIKLELTDGRILRELEDSLDPGLFDGFDFLGFRAGLNYTNKDDADFPTHGVGFNTELGYRGLIGNAENDISHAYLKADFSFYQKLDLKGNIVVAMRVGTSHIFNEDFAFYHGATLGGVGPASNFRGWRRERFTGQTAFYHNTDLRLKLVTVDNSSFPVSIGILAGFDHGRVWLADDQSKKWHYSYGGGLILSPFDILSINMSMFVNDEKINRFVLGGAFFF